MCGYIRRNPGSSSGLHLLAQLGLDPVIDAFSGVGDTEHFYPAFGGNPSRQIRQLIIPGDRGAATVDATWWFDCREQGDTLEVGQRTTFNARNLESPFWRGALRQHRGLVLATGLGESKIVDGNKHQYLMEGKGAFLMGALYRPFANGCFSCAVITRDSHPRFEPYHDKAFPLFIPPDRDFVDAWLNDTGHVPDVIADYLEHPAITEELLVTRVKSFKSGETALDAIALPAD